MSIVPTSAKTEPDTVAEMIRYTEHVARSDHDVIRKAGLRQLERIDAVRQFDPENEAALGVRNTSAFGEMVREQPTPLVDSRRDRRTDLAVSCFDARLRQEIGQRAL